MFPKFKDQPEMKSILSQMFPTTVFAYIARKYFPKVAGSPRRGMEWSVTCHRYGKPCILAATSKKCGCVFEIDIKWNEDEQHFYVSSSNLFHIGHNADEDKQPRKRSVAHLYTCNPSHSG